LTKKSKNNITLAFAKNNKTAKKELIEANAKNFFIYFFNYFSNFR
jgi:hypothetical protein